MFTLDDWPSTYAAAPHVHWFPCQDCGDWFYRVSLTSDPKANILTVYAVCWSDFAMRCELCDYAHRNAVAESKAKHPAFWKRSR